MNRRQRIRGWIIFLSFLLFPVTLNFLSPYLIAAGAGEGILSGSSLFFLGLLGTSLFFGRGWCGWVCPAAGCQEAASRLTGMTPPKRVRTWVQFLIFGLWMAGIIALFISAGGIIAADPLYMSDSVISVDAPAKYIVYYGVLLIILLLNRFIGSRGFCLYLCWMAPFMIFGRKIRNLTHLPALVLKAERSLCISCRRCDRVCPMGLPVTDSVQQGRMEHQNCILCGSCADTCPKNVLKLTWSRDES